MTSLPADIECLSALTDGEDCWAMFWERYGGFIVCELRRLGVGSGPERDDLYQELVTKLIAHDYQVIRRYLSNQTGLPFVALLKTVIRSIVIDDWRKNKKWREVSLRSHWNGDHDGGLVVEGGPAEILHRRVRMTCIIEGLSRDMRDEYAFKVMHLRFVEERPVNIIARQLGLSPNAVSQRLRIYKRKLREHYGQELAEMLDD